MSCKRHPCAGRRRLDLDGGASSTLDQAIKPGSTVYPTKLLRPCSSALTCSVIVQAATRSCTTRCRHRSRHRPPQSLQTAGLHRRSDHERPRENPLVRGILPIIPSRSIRKAPEHPDCRRYQDRNRVEPMIAMLKQQRRIDVCYDEIIPSCQASSQPCWRRPWLQAFVNAA